MENNIIQFLSQFVHLTEEEAALILQHNLLRNYPKGHILLNEGQVAQECFFVVKGCVRSYYLLDGEEKTTEFYTESQPITPVSYIHKAPSEYTLVCVEDCILSIGNDEKTKQLLAHSPKMVAMTNKIGNALMAEQQVSFDLFKTHSPEQRYLKLLELRPSLIHRVPQYQLASYLGIKPESLSRIRKRLAEKNGQSFTS